MRGKHNSTLHKIYKYFSTAPHMPVQIDKAVQPCWFTKSTPGSAGGKRNPMERGRVDKKKSPS